MRVFLCAIAIVTAFMLFAVSCGKPGELGSVNGTPITTVEYLTVFNGLPADQQVSVLEPGGRMGLMNKIVMKRALLAAWREDPSVSDGWEQLYTVSMLSDSMYNRLGAAYNYQGYLDSLASCGCSGFSLRFVLLDDSVEAENMSLKWNTGNFDTSVPSLSAPWSLADGSSYSRLGGSVQHISRVFLPALEMETGVAHVLPMYGEWCVCILDLTQGDWQPDDAAAGIGFMRFVFSAAPYTVLSKGISALADNCTVTGDRVIPAGNGTADPVVLIGEDTLTVEDILNVMTMAAPENFPGEVPSEIAMLSPPEVVSTREITMWSYTDALAQKYSLADKAVEQGITIPENALDFARAESVVRARVLTNSTPDSAGVASWYEDNTDLFVVPERRSVFLGYTDSTVTIDPDTVSGFIDLPDCQTIIGEDGSVAPTPLQIEQVFGGILGPVVFAADSGVFTGPVDLNGELAAWFEVVEIVPAEVARLEDVYSLAESMIVSALFSSGFNALMEELYEQYSVTVDTAAVVDIDLWGGTQ
jgi:hypothetical protein